MEKRVLVGGIEYICNCTYSDHIEHWSCANAERVSDYLRKNGAKVLSINTSDVPQRIDVDRSVYRFKGEEYTLNQCETDLFGWFEHSNDGEFTYYYDKIVFHTEDGFIAAYRDDISNNWKF